MIDPNKYPKGSETPALKPDTIGYPKVTAAVLTVAEVNPDAEVPTDGGGTRLVLTVRFQEFPDHTWFTNKTSREILFAKLGLDEAKWIGKKIPLIVVQTNNPKTRTPQPSLWAAPADEWDAHLAAVGKKARRR